MKKLLALFLLGFSVGSMAEVCTSVIKDRSGYEWETFTRSSYSQQAACDQATYDCRGALSYGQSIGRYYDAACEIKFDRPNPYPNPTPYPTPLICQTDLVDYYGRTVRSFTAPGSSEWDACNTSDNFCKSELARNDSYGYRCVNRGLIGNRNDPRRPERTRTEQCSANRLDPAGMFIQSYFATATGPINSDVLGDACRRAISDCSREIRGRQTCNIAR
ncbi:MAG: hypothetical protein PHY93_06680 [Bacteriovorax sp.]|nr:hypothetical protein [Bacteriovorax sp.]